MRNEFMSKLKWLLVAVLAITVWSCATPQQKQREKREMMEVIGF